MTEISEFDPDLKEQFNKPETTKNRSTNAANRFLARTRKVTEFMQQKYKAHPTLMTAIGSGALYYAGAYGLLFTPILNLAAMLGGPAWLGTHLYRRWKNSQYPKKSNL